MQTHTDDDHHALQVCQPFIIRGLILTATIHMLTWLAFPTQIRHDQQRAQMDHGSWWLFNWDISHWDGARTFFFYLCPVKN